MGTEQQADGVGPPWVKVEGGIGKGLSYVRSRDKMWRETLGFSEHVSSRF